MRELKFRVWDNENKSYDDPYSYAYYALTQDGGLDFYCHGDHMKEADPDVYFIEQYTGLKDKNGKEICEGDIVSYRGNNYRIKWCEASFAYIASSKNQYYWLSPSKSTVLEVIGNIHENPELVEEEE